MYAPRRKWVLPEHDRTAIKALAEALEVPPLAAQLLRLRGVTGPDDGRAFLQPRIDALSDPFLLTDMEAAVARLRLARDREEKVLIFGDYDVDGIAAAAVMWRALRRYGIRKVTCGMPDRLAEGYGINVERVEAAHADGVNLVITVDNGVRAHDAANRARELGIGLIVTDHHAIDGALPEAAAVVNPKRESPAHPAWDLCGAGVAFKIAEALNGTKNDLDIVAVGTVADMVPLLGENRVIVSLGLRHMAQHRRTGLAQLAAAAGKNIRSLRARDIGYQLGPRLNAAGRMGEGLPSLRLLLSDDAAEARRIATELNTANEERRAVEKAIFDEIMARLAGSFEPAQRAIVLASPDWHPGVIGIVATRVVARYHRPVVLMAIEEAGGTARGSARGIPGFDTVGAFAACADCLTQYGGHVAAAGFAMDVTQLPRFEARFEEEARRQLGDGELFAELRVDAQTTLSDLDMTLMNTIEHLEPLGQMNPSPVFCAYNVEHVARSARVLKDAHLKFAVREDGRVFDVIGFNMADSFHPECLPERLDIAFTPEINTWNGQSSIQLVLKDLRQASGPVTE